MRVADRDGERVHAGFLQRGAGKNGGRADHEKERGERGADGRSSCRGPRNGSSTSRGGGAARVLGLETGRRGVDGFAQLRLAIGIEAVDGDVLAFTSDATSAAPVAEWGTGPEEGGWATSHVYVWDRTDLDLTSAVRAVSFVGDVDTDG